ncbi:hypothetical protein [Streptomyces griseus]
MELVTPEQADELDGLLAGATKDVLAAERQSTMSDIAFALERHVESGLSAPSRPGTSTAAATTSRPAPS